MTAARRSSTTCCASCGRAFSPPRSFQRTRYRPASCRSSTSASRARRSRSAGARPAAATSSPASCPTRAPSPARWSSRRSSRTSPSGWRAALTVSARCPQKLVWDREGAIAPRRPPDRGLPRLLRPARARLGHPRRGRLPGQGRARALHRFLHGNFEAGRRFANPLDFQLQLDGWCDKINARVHRTTRAVVSSAWPRSGADAPAARLVARHRPPLGDPGPRPALPALRPQRLLARPAPGRPPRRGARLASRELDRVRARHAASSPPATRASSPAGSPSPTPPTSGCSSELRGERRRPASAEVERRPLARYDALIPA